MKSSEYTPEMLMEMMRAFQPACVIDAALELDVFGSLEAGPRTSRQLAKSLKCSVRGMEGLCNALAAIGLLNKRGDKFSLTPFSKKHMVPGKPGYKGWMARHSAHIMDSWRQLADSVRTGKPAPRPDRNSPAGKKRHYNFIMAMHNHASARAGLLVSKISLKGVKRVLDVGGGPGTYAMAFARAEPTCTVDILDVPPTCVIARDNIRAAGLEDRVQTIEGDFNKDPLGRGYDLILMSSIMHIYSAAQNKKLVKRAYGALNPGGRLFILEIKLDKSQISPEGGALFTINMLVNTETGKAYAPEEMKPWLTSAGFKNVKQINLDDRLSALSGTRPAAVKKK